MDSENFHQLTSYHVRCARSGDADSLEWVIRKFSPLLAANARYRLGKVLGQIYEPEDLVNDVWLVALGRLPDLPERDGRYTPVLLKFLSTTLIYRINNLVNKHIRGKPKRERGGGGDREEADGVGVDLPADTVQIVTRLCRQEVRDAVAEAISGLDERERSLVILRGIEQQPYREIALVVGGDAKVLAVQYQRALKKLRERLPGSVFEEFVLE